ncbi:MAG: thioredoxin [Verrucomicrobiota bacterium]
MKIHPLFLLAVASIIGPFVSSAQERTYGKVSIEPAQTVADVEKVPTPVAEVEPVDERRPTPQPQAEPAPPQPQPRPQAQPQPRPEPAPQPRAQAPVNTEPVEVTTDNFNDFVIDNERFVLVDFWAPWCGPCRSMGPSIDRIARNFAGRVDVATINVDEQRELAEHMEVEALPTLFIFKNGRPVDELVGYADERTLVRSLEHELSQPVRDPEPRRELEPAPEQLEERDPIDRRDRLDSRGPDPRAITRGSRSFP